MPDRPRFAPRFALCLALLLMLASGCEPGPTTGEASPRQAYDEGAAAARAALEAAEAGDNALFLRESRRALAFRPNHPSYLLLTARAYVLNQQPHRAQDLLVRFAKLGLVADLRADSVFARIADEPRFARIQRVMEENRRSPGRATRAFELSDPAFAAEGIAWDAQTGRVLLGSLHQRRLLAVGRDGQVDTLAAGRDSLWSVVGLAFDPERRILWVATTGLPQTRDLAPAFANRAALAKIALDADSLLGIYLLPADSTVHGFGDLTLVGEGVPYLTGGRNGAVYRFDESRRTFETITPPGTLVSPQGLCEFQEALWIADYALGLMRLDPNSGEVTAVPMPQEAMLYGIDGLICTPTSLVAVQNGSVPHRLLQVFVEHGEVTDVEVLETNHDDFGEPTLGTRDGQTLYVIANSPWPHFDEAGRLMPDAPNPVVLRLDLDSER